MFTTPKSGFSRGGSRVAVDWQDCGWCPIIAVQSGWGEAPDELSSRHFDAPWPARPPSAVALLRRTGGDQPWPGYGATGARSAKTANHAVIRSPRVIKPLPRSARLPLPARHDPVFFKTMKNMPIHSRRRL